MIKFNFLSLYCLEIIDVDIIWIWISSHNKQNYAFVASISISSSSHNNSHNHEIIRRDDGKQFFRIIIEILEIVAAALINLYVSKWHHHQSYTNWHTKIQTKMNSMVLIFEYI